MDSEIKQYSQMASSYGSEILWSFAILFWIQFGFRLILHKKLMTNFKYYDMQILKDFWI